MGSLTVKVSFPQSCCTPSTKKPSEFDFISVHSSVSRRIDKEIAEKLKLVENQVTYISEDENSQDFVLQKIKQSSALTSKLSLLRSDLTRLAQLQQVSPSKQLKVTFFKPSNSDCFVTPLGSHFEGVTVFTIGPTPSLLIHFGLEQDRYLLTDLGCGFFVKLDLSCVLHNGQIFRMGNSYVLVKLEPLDCLLRVNTLTLEIYAPGMTSIRKFYAIDSASHVFFIGREGLCDIQVEDRMLSKVQASLFYNGVEWVLVDGNLEQKRTSTNGTWLYIGEDFEVTDSVTVKNSEVTLQITPCNK